MENCEFSCRSLMAHALVAGIIVRAIWIATAFQLWIPETSRGVDRE